MWYSVDMIAGTACVLLVLPSLHQAPGSQPVEKVRSPFHMVIASIGDLDADETNDLLLGAPYADVAGQDSGSVVAVSGRTGALLFTAHGKDAGDALGAEVTRLGDVDRDGIEDLAAASYYDDSQAGSVTVLSGKTGATLYSIRGTHAGDLFGCALGGGVDFNGDGTSDLVVGAPGDWFQGPGSAYVSIFDGRTGTRIRTIEDPAAGWIAGLMDKAGDLLDLDLGEENSRFGMSVRSLPSMGDPGAPGLVVSCPEEGEGALYFFDAEGDLVHKTPEGYLEDPFSICFALAPPFEDGHDLLAVGIESTRIDFIDLKDFSVQLEVPRGPFDGPARGFADSIALPLNPPEGRASVVAGYYCRFCDPIPESRLAIVALESPSIAETVDWTSRAGVVVCPVETSGELPSSDVAVLRAAIGEVALYSLTTQSLSWQVNIRAELSK